MNIFERAARNKIRFASVTGNLTTEQIWDLPLTAKGDQSDLDKIARAVNAELRSIVEGSFVVTKPDPRKTELELKLEILKYIIETKLTAQETAKKNAENNERKRKLMTALEAKEENELSSMTKEQLLAEIEKITAQ